MPESQFKLHKQTSTRFHKNPVRACMSLTRQKLVPKNGAFHPSIPALGSLLRAGELLDGHSTRDFCQSSHLGLVSICYADVNPPIPMLAPDSHPAVGLKVSASSPPVDRPSGAATSVQGNTDRPAVLWVVPRGPGLLVRILSQVMKARSTPPISIPSPCE